MRLPEPDAAFLASCLRGLAAVAPCEARIRAVAASIERDSAAPFPEPATDVLGAAGPAAGAIGDSLFVRSLALSAVLWSIDSGLVEAPDQERAQRVLDDIWRRGAIRPELIAVQLHCLTSQPEDQRVCVWSCAQMPHANAGYDPQLNALAPTVSGLLGTVVAEEADTLALARLDAAVRRGPVRWTPRYGARVVCKGCGHEGTVLGVDDEDGWTVIDHHPGVREREDGLWEVVPAAPGAPRQCRFLDHGAELQRA